MARRGELWIKTPGPPSWRLWSRLVPYSSILFRSSFEIIGWLWDKRFGILERFFLPLGMLGDVSQKSILEDLRRKIYMVIISKGSKGLDQYSLNSSGVEQEKRAAVAPYIKKKWQERICTYYFVSGWILTMRITIDRGYTTVIVVWSRRGQSMNQNYFIRIFTKLRIK